MARASSCSLVLLAVLAGSPLAAQVTPVSKQIEIAPGVTDPLFSPAAVATGPLGFAAAWARTSSSSVSGEVSGRRLTRSGALGTAFRASTDVAPGDNVGRPSLARIGESRFVAVWCQTRDLGAGVWFRRFEGDGRPLDPGARQASGSTPDDRTDCNPAVAGNAGGRFVIAWIRVQEKEHTWQPMAQVFDAGGTALTGEIEVSPAASGGLQERPAVGLDAAGNFMVLWQRPQPSNIPGGIRDVQGRRFDASGNPLAPAFFLANSFKDGGIAMAMTPKGTFVATWRDISGRVALRRFVSHGAAVGLLPVFPLSGATYDPAISMDRFGNVALFWVEERRTALALFNQSLILQAPLLYEPPVSRLAGLPPGGGVALADDGRLLTTWTGPRRGAARESILGRVWQVRKDADLCLTRGTTSGYSCDTANNGGGAEQLPFAVAHPGQPNASDSQPVMGDFNGDGRDDLCAYQEHRFFCDVDHDGIIAEAVSNDFGAVGASPAIPALGDLDGDGRDDPCVRNANLWACDLHREDGLTPDLTFSFIPAAAPLRGALMGDVDGDGRDEACVAIIDDERIFCDTGHDGGTAETVLDLRRVTPQRATAWPLLGDVDGDGMDDPCFFGGDLLSCGLFHPGETRPSRTFRLSFTFQGGQPVLGNFDAF